VKKQWYDEYMRDAISRRKSQPPRASFKRVIFFFFLLLTIGLLLATVFYSIPTIIAYLSQKGYVSPLSRQFSLPDALGNSVSEETVKQALGKAHFTLKKIEGFDDGYIVTLKSGEKVLFSKKKPLDEQISSLQLISSRLTIEGKQFSQLDLRFDRPVLVPK
jgi:hypothetical protein